MDVHQFFIQTQINFAEEQARAEFNQASAAEESASPTKLNRVKPAFARQPSFKATSSNAQDKMFDMRYFM